MGRDALGEPGAQRVGVEVAVRDDERDGTSPVRGSGWPVTAASATQRMGEQQRLELGGRDLQRVDLDQLLDAVDDEQVAVGVDAGEVAGPQPAVGAQAVGRRR